MFYKPVYKIFISHTTLDQPIVKRILTVLNNALKGQVQLYLAHLGVIGGGSLVRNFRS